jgi:hypothetical protein
MASGSGGADSLLVELGAVGGSDGGRSCGIHVGGGGDLCLLDGVEGGVVVDFAELIERE